MNSVISVFSPQQWQVLRALGQYRFLTVEQMLRLGISKNAKSLRDKTLFALRFHKCIHSEKVGSFLPDIHHLTAQGQAYLYQIEPWQVILAPSNKRTPFSALFARHRFAQVDFHIGLRQWVEKRADAEVILELQDFIRHPQAATELKIPNYSRPVIPDGTFAVTTTNGRTAAYLVEVHRATQSQAVHDQLTRYYAVIQTQAFQQKYGLVVNPVICSVHYVPSVLASVKRRLLANPEFAPFKRNFVFRALDGLSESFSSGWHFADDTTANPFPIASH